MRGRDLFVGLTFALAWSMATAQQLRDPTRPPGGKTVSAKTGPSTESRSYKGMVLQTVLLSTDRRKAVISGRVMSVGDRLSGYRLVEIRESEVVMKGSGGTRTLHLYPLVKKVEAAVMTSPDHKKGSE